MSHRIVRIVTSRRLAGDLLASYLTSAQLAAEATVVAPEALDTNHPEGESFVIVDGPGVLAPFELPDRFKAEHSRGPLRWILLAENLGDYTVWKAPAAGYGAVVVASDSLSILNRAFETLESGGRLHRNVPDKGRRIRGILTSRQLQVFEMTALGRSDAWIADRLGLAETTVESHRRDIMLKLGSGSWGGLLLQAIREGVVNPSGVDIKPWERRSSRSHGGRDTPTAQAVV